MNATEKKEESLSESEEMVTIFMGDLYNCRERMHVLEEEGIPSFIVGDKEQAMAEVGQPVLELRVKQVDLQDVIEIFQEIWKETLQVEGLQAQDDAIDFSQDTITCPGCQTETDTVTEEGECPECGLFLGLPEEEGEEEEAED